MPVNPAQLANIALITKHLAQIHYAVKSLAEMSLRLSGNNNA